MEIIKTLAECFVVQCFFWLIGGTVNYFRTGKFNHSWYLALSNLARS